MKTNLTPSFRFKRKPQNGLACCAIPFAGSFTYKGSEINGTGFSDYSTGEILMSNVPFWVKLNYQFSSGQKRESIERLREEIESIQRRGF